MKTGLIALTALLAVVPFAFGSTQLRPGALDSQFGRGGRVATSIERFAGADAVTIQPDGRIVVAGDAAENLDPVAPVGGFALARYRANGSLDPSFGGGGVSTLDAGGASVTALSLQPDGKIVVGWVGYTRDTPPAFDLARYRADGSLDSSFGSGGSVYTSPCCSLGYLEGIVLQPDGKIVAVGQGLARYNPDGSLDTSFGTDGIVAKTFGYDLGQAWAVALQPDGKIVLVGYGAGNGLVGRYNPDGSLDTGFGTGGIVVTPVGSYSQLALQPDGKIVITGGADCNDNGCARIRLLRYRSDGSLDPTFGKGGVVTTKVLGAGNAPVSAGSVALQSDGKIVVGGDSSDGSALVRYNPDGSLDQTFGRRGKVVDTFHRTAKTLGTFLINAIAIQRDGKLVTAGTFAKRSGSKFAVARFLSGAEHCNVPKAVGQRLAKARLAIRRAYCSTGKITRVASANVSKGRVIAQKPSAGTEHRFAARVDLIVSNGETR